MKLATSRSGIVLVLAALLQACGGGGGGGDGDGNGAGAAPRLTLSTTSISAAATPGDDHPFGSVILNVSNAPAAGLFVFYSGTDTGLLGVTLNSGIGAGTLSILFRGAGSLQNGTYNDTITIRVCRDDPCTSQISGSPATVTTTYVVSGTGTSTVSADPGSIQYTTDTDDLAARQETVRLTLVGAPHSGVFVDVDHTSNVIQQVRQRSTSLTLVELDITFRPGIELGPTDFSDTIDITMCYDLSCVREVEGSPITITADVAVFMPSEPGVPRLEVTSRQALAHDIIDAEFSNALNRIVMIGQFPVNALYVYDAATGTEHQQPLNWVPISVSVAPDGLTAAVGHDAQISIVDLTTVGQAGAPAPTILDVGSDVNDVVLDGNGYVHVLPRLGDRVEIHSVQVSTNTEQLSTGRQIWAGARGRLHPSGDYLYTANARISPDDLEKWDIGSGAAAWLYDSPYHGDFMMCNELWIPESGSIILTACGHAFQSSTDPAQDLLHVGSLEMYEAGSLPFRIRSLSHAAAQGEFAVVEHDFLRCVLLPGSEICYTHLAYFEDASLDRLDFYTFAPVRVNGRDYAQQGLFVFHDAVGTDKYVLSKLLGAPGPDLEYYLSVVP